MERDLALHHAPQLSSGYPVSAVLWLNRTRSKSDYSIKIWRRGRDEAEREERKNSPYGQSEEQRTHKENKTEKRADLLRRVPLTGTTSVCVYVQKANDVTTVWLKLEEEGE
jgi:hypothetical protein